MTLPQQQRHNRALWPHRAIHPANENPGAVSNSGTMGTAVRSRGCTAGRHGNPVASSTGCQRVSVHQLFLFLDPRLFCLFHTFGRRDAEAAQGQLYYSPANKSWAINHKIIKIHHSYTALFHSCIQYENCNSVNVSTKFVSELLALLVLWIFQPFWDYAHFLEIATKRCENGDSDYD